jgi:protein-tyrosine kinase
VDADLRAPKQHVLFALENRRGLTSVLANYPGDGIVRPVPGFSSLCVVTSGPPAPNPQELINRDRFRRLLDEYRAQFDVILLDTSAGSEGADAQIVAAHAKSAVLLTCLHKSRIDQTTAMREGVSAAGTPIVGAIINKR